MRAKNLYMDYLLDGVAKEYAEKLNDTLHSGQFYGRAERLVRLNADGEKIKMTLRVSFKKPPLHQMVKSQINLFMN